MAYLCGMRYSAVFVFLLVLASCSNGGSNDSSTVVESDTSEIKKPEAQAEFNMDSAYSYVQKQVSFGPRVPGTATWKKCHDYLVKFMKEKADTVYLQYGSASTFDGKTIPVNNIIGVFNPEATSRILLCAHWDTRPFADQDTKDRDKPILGANDGASGVGILMEIASQLKKSPVDFGVDIIFFDSEDWGDPSGRVENSFCLGSQYWGNNLHVKNYTADFGVLLDMVGAPNAMFGFEGYSSGMGQSVLSRVWNTASGLGYSQYFKNFQRGYVIDDHYYVMKATKIPMIDIIDADLTTESQFGRYWHTHSDNMDAIDRNTLKAVGHTLMHVLRNY